MDTVRPENEEERIETLHELQILGSERLPEFDSVVEALAAIFDCPIALVSLVSEDEQWFKARCGLDVEGTPRDVSFCQHAILSDELFIVEDTHADKRFKNNPLVTGAPNIRFYAGCPLSIDDRNRLGTLCVIDRVPRSPSRQQLNQLRRLGKVVEGLIKSHEIRREKDAALAQAEQEHELAVQKNDLLEEITSVSGVGGWELCVRTKTLTWTDKTKEIHEVPSDFRPTVDFALSFYPPDSRHIISKAVEDAIELGVSWDAELPFVTAKGRNIWVRAAGRPIVKDGEVIRIVGALQDVTARKKTEQSVRCSESMHRATLHTLSEGVLLLSRSGRIRSINKAGEDLLGCSHEDVVDTRFKDLDLEFRLEDKAYNSPEDLFRQIANGSDHVNGTVVHVTRRKETGGAWLRINAASIGETNEFGLDGIVVSLTDITETKTQRDTLQAIFDNFPGGMVYFDEALHLQNYNDAFQNAFKLPKELLSQKPHLKDTMMYAARQEQRVASKAEKVVEERYNPFMSGKPVQLERVTADGTVLDVRSTPLPNGGIVFSLLDISDHKRREQTIRQSEVVQRATLEALSEGILLLSRDGVIESANPVAEKLFGFDDNGLTGLRIDELARSVTLESSEFINNSDPLKLAVHDPDAVTDLVASLSTSYRHGLTWLRINARPIDPLGENGLDGVVVSIADITETKEQADTLQAIFDNFPGGFAYYDENFQLGAANSEFGHLLGYPQDFVDQKLHLLDYLKYNAERGDYGEGDPEQLALDKFHSYDRTQPHSYVRGAASGSYLEIRGTPLPSGGFVYNFFDVTDRKRMESQLAESERASRSRSLELEAILANMRQGVSVFDKDGRLRLWNKQYIDIFNKPEDDVREGVTLVDLIEAEKARGEFDGDVIEHVRDLLIRLSAGEVVRSKFRHPSGRFISAVHAPLPGGGWIGTHEDVTKSELAVQKIEYAAHHDTLTGLANRTLFNSRLDETLEELDQDSESALMLLDLDKFKPVNDTYGHDAGDALLKQVSERLKACVRSTDLVARLGGDEFGIILNSASRTVAEVIASRIVHKLQGAFSIKEHTIRIGVSVGISPISGSRSDANAIIKNADVALYDVKNSGRNDFRFFDLPAEPGAMNA
ncbi:diguanylate cyclase (GGDEF)-like protein/PAS domain S-box-containing protein [Labrenzia sp. EL_208]|nr:diguanylate cyclase (GGDEF)-like protein/PAS domain S-box-containing protein [Labrenzia sp. EL_132]MBG6229708.1 diguanylate cyclase (GGDEF)-like protein/PAS domain S-box-containing protein [Labrenzia sp. EL_208]